MRLDHYLSRSGSTALFSSRYHLSRAGEDGTRPLTTSVGARYHASRACTETAGVSTACLGSRYHASRHWKDCGCTTGASASSCCLLWNAWKAAVCESLISSTVRKVLSFPYCTSTTYSKTMRSSPAARTASLDVSARAVTVVPDTDGKPMSVDC